MTHYQLLLGGLLVLNLMAILFFSFLHYRLLLWNYSELKCFRKSASCSALKNSNAEVSLMVIPLTLAMSVNVAFILGALFVPGLWQYVEYLFPFALLGFFAVGLMALKILGAYFTRLFTVGDFDFASNNNLSQMIAIFALAMISVGMAAPGAMSQNIQVNAIGIFLSIFW